MKQSSQRVSEWPLPPLSLWPAKQASSPRQTMRSIAIDVAEAHQLTVADLRQKTARHSIAHPRQEAMAQMHEAGFSHHQIVRFFGLGCHTTSVYACQIVKERRAAYSEAA